MGGLVGGIARSAPSGGLIHRRGVTSGALEGEHALHEGNFVSDGGGGVHVTEHIVGEAGQGNAAEVALGGVLLLASVLGVAEGRRLRSSHTNSVELVAEHALETLGELLQGGLVAIGSGGEVRVERELVGVSSLASRDSIGGAGQLDVNLVGVSSGLPVLDQTLLSIRDTAIVEGIHGEIHALGNENIGDGGGGHTEDLQTAITLDGNFKIHSDVCVGESGGTRHFIFYTKI